MSDVPISVLDLAPVVTGSTAAQALRNTLELARHVERLGYHRYWVAEHHNMPGIASSSPAVLIGHIADATSRIRVGSGGVMLPNHTPLVVAEQFGMLEALHQGRIDLGIGRAPGTDPATARALRRAPGPLSADDFPDQLLDLVSFFTGSFPEEHPLRRISAVPATGNVPSIWLLGSSGFSAQVAGMLGLPFAFAHHFSAANTLPALELYRSSFRPSEALEQPYALVGVGVICADTPERAQDLAQPGRLSFVRLRRGQPGKLPTPEEAAAHEFTPDELLLLEHHRASNVIGDPDQVREGLTKLLEATRADELMITTNTYDFADRLRSYELVADLLGLTAPEPS
ncbi:MAG: LLM class flavin-dependent oxidoreductase [Candidatus Dormibacteraeota bacterium]|nr:LLM class flavin-dependent oxidoreductase [Candidatus Dormibacteraeota bacterium]